MRSRQHAPPRADEGRAAVATVVYAEGANYRISLEGAHVRCAVWRRPDLTREQGQTCALEKIRHLSALAGRPRLLARALVLDLSDAPETWGPVTHAALEQIVRAWESVGRAVVVVGGTSAIRKLTLRRLVTEVAPRHGVVVPTMAEALERVG